MQSTSDFAVLLAVYRRLVDLPIDPLHRLAAFDTAAQEFRCKFQQDDYLAVVKLLRENLRPIPKETPDVRTSAAKARPKAATS